MKKHDYNLIAGDSLRRMGVAWFVSYLYYKKLDGTHGNWRKVSTTDLRIREFDKTQKYHRIWLEEVLSMGESKLDKNSIGLIGADVKAMAKALLDAKLV